MGVAKADRNLRRAIWPMTGRRGLGQRDLSGADEDAGRRGDRRRAQDFQTYRHERAAAPLTRRLRRWAALRGSSGERCRRLHHRRDHPRRWRLSRSGDATAREYLTLARIRRRIMIQAKGGPPMPRMIFINLPISDGRLAALLRGARFRHQRAIFGRHALVVSDTIYVMISDPREIRPVHAAADSAKAVDEPDVAVLR